MSQAIDKAEQFRQLREIVRKNGVDAWDLGFEGHFRSTEIDRAVRDWLDRHGFEHTKKIFLTLKKR